MRNPVNHCPLCGADSSEFRRAPAGIEHADGDVYICIRCDSAVIIEVLSESECRKIMSEAYP
jgi:hypothetical protein